jgi:hypothetical protein
MIYGVSGSTKTSQLYHLAKMILRMAEKERGRKCKLRMIHSDGGGYAPFIDSGMIERGEVEVFDYSNRVMALADLRKLSEGYWPRWVWEDGKAHIEYKEGAKEYFVKHPTCMTTKEEWEGIAGYLIEGMSSIGDGLKAHISNQPQGVGFKESWSYTEEDYTITGLQMGHYGMVQKEFEERHKKGFNSLPIPWLVYTSLQGKGEDKQNRETVYGPLLVGSATVSSAPAWFMDVIHLEKVKWNGDASPKVKELELSGDGEHEGMVAWFTQHNDINTSVPYLVKARVMPDKFPELISYFPFGFVPLGFRNGLNAYFSVLEKLRKG